MSTTMLARLAHVVAVAAFANAAYAVPVTFTITGGSATTSGVSVGSTVTATPSDGLARTFELEVGESTDLFDFLDVTVTGVGVVSGYMEASLNFSNPTTAAANGVLGGFAVLLGWASGGVLSVLSDPAPIAFGDGGLFDVDFFGFADACLDCTSLNGTVTARVSLLQAPTAPVPEPATLSLLGAGLLAAGFARRRLRKNT